MIEKRLVWDLPLRVFHWLLVLSIAASWYTAKKGDEYLNIGDFSVGYIQVHFWLGYCALGMILFRLIWGFVGPRHARFSSFIKGPSATFAYIRSLSSRNYVPAPGHNPLGAWSVVLLLLMIGAQAVTGLFLIDNTEFYLAPYHQTVERSTAAALIKFHFFNFDVLLWAIGLHVLAVLFYVFAKRQNLVTAMLSGHKPGHLVSEQEAITGSQLLKALIVIAIAAGAVWLLIDLAPPIVYEDDN